MEKVLKNIFFENDNLEDNIKFWVLLGPFFLILSLALASFDFAILSLIWLFFCYRIRLKGLFLSLASLVIYSFFTQVNLEEKHLWNLGLELSIGLSLIISTFGFEEIKLFLKSNKEDSQIDQKQINTNSELEKKHINFIDLQKNFEQNINTLKSELKLKSELIDQKNDEIDSLKKVNDENALKKDYLFNELDQKIKEIEDLKNVQDELYEKISFLKDEEFLHEKNKNLQADVEKLNLVIQKQKEDIEKANIELSKKDKEISNFELKQNQKLSDESKVEELSKIIKEKEAEIANILKETNQSPVADDSLLKEKNLLEEKNLKLVNELETYQTKLEKEKESINKNLLLINEKNEQISKLDNQINEYKIELSKTKDLINRLKEKEIEIQKLKSNISTNNISQPNSIKVSTDIKETQADENKQKEYKELQSLHKQLKIQFDEKNQLLHDTRQELFLVKEKLVAIQRNQNHDLEDLSESEKTILKDLNTSQMELEKYIIENANLENMVNSLIDKKETKRSKKSDQEIKPNEASEQEFLNLE
jgi:hypothetical protein